MLIALIGGLGLWIAVEVHGEYGLDASLQVLIPTLVVAVALGLDSARLLTSKPRDKNGS